MPFFVIVQNSPRTPFQGTLSPLSAQLGGQAKDGTANPKVDTLDGTEIDTAKCRSYPRYLTPDSELFDPVALACETERIVCRGAERKYTKFYATGVYGGIATGYGCGCCLRCVFCWVDPSRDFPEQHGEFYSPEEILANLKEAACRGRVNKLGFLGQSPHLARSISWRCWSLWKH